MATTTKARQPRLRASCDGCFLAKVKCSKTRPVCSRCLACGIICNYSPSSRAGKPKPDSSHNAHSNPPHDIQLRSLIDDKALAYLQPPAPDHMFTNDTSWNSTPTSIENPMSRNASLPSNLSMLGINDGQLSQQDPMSAPPELYSATMPWTTPTDISCASFSELPLATTHIQGPHGRSQSFDANSMSMQTQTAWGGDPNTHDISYPYPQVQTPASISANYFPNTMTAAMHPTLTYHQNNASCMCFSTSLQSLLDLQTLSLQNPPSFDTVLSTNQKAVEACSTMLDCSVCLNQPGKDTVAMIIATIMNKVALLSKGAHYSGSGSFSLGLYQYQFHRDEGDWLVTEMMIRELQKLEEVFTRFREICADIHSVPEFPNDLLNYIGRNIRSTLDAAIQRKSGENPTVS
ncbi:hypothetical protein O1611_g3955 [Lasiodiplodia mahajangana]|uniref:Uncharacterized protein n=1 Tax=Lasiodiplodia mahajangana TaxID=1108764 RepID=A0ACC2JQI1_9PEZI|nr:hypothetical protein O1611_g3955 [Lasiodiplodia mahajangana]